MEITEYKFRVAEYASIDELPEDDKQLLEIAKEAAGAAYAPYSQYYVGAAVKLDNGAVVKGNNQENAAYPSGLCAERVGIFAASAVYPGVAINAIAITAKAKNFEVNYPVTPCGACRQALSEYEQLQKKPVKLILSGVSGKIRIIEKVEDILPFCFSGDELKRD